jgi:hypothetical protein
VEQSGMAVVETMDGSRQDLHVVAEARHFVGQAL